MIDIERERQRHRQREMQAPCWEPDAGLDPGPLGLCPEPKADAQLLNHPRVPIPNIKKKKKINPLWKARSWISSLSGHLHINALTKVK